MFSRVSVLLFCCACSLPVLADGGSDENAKDLVEESFTAAPVDQRTFELYASDKTAQGRYDRDSSMLNMENGRVHGSFLYNEERDLVFTAGLNMDVEPDFMKGVIFSVGTRGYAALLSAENSDAIAISVGLEAQYTLPLKKFPLHFEAAVYYAPDIFTFGQSDRVLDWQGRVGLAITETMDAFVGLRYLEFDTRPGSKKLDNKVHIGVRWTLGD